MHNKEDILLSLFKADLTAKDAESIINILKSKNLFPIGDWLNVSLLEYLHRFLDWETSELKMDEVKRIVVRFIQYYNLRRIYSVNGGYPPAVFRKRLYEKKGQCKKRRCLGFSHLFLLNHY